MRTLRTLLILIGRQFTDDGRYLVGVFGVAACCLLILGLLAFIYPHGLLLSGGLVFGVLPVAVGTALFAFGLFQTYGDHVALALLSVLSARPLIVLARLIVGVVFAGIVVMALALTIAGGIRNGLMRWPESFPLREQISLFAGLFEVGLACYCLGLMVAQKARVFPAALRAWPLVLIVASLIVARGMGRPLAILLVSLIVVSLLYLLTVERHPHLGAITIGAVVLALTLALLYWLRISSDVGMARMMLESSHEASVTCYREFLPEETRISYSDARFTVHCEVYGPYCPFLERTAIAKYSQRQNSGGNSIYRWFARGRWTLSYDAQNGVFVRGGDPNTLYAGAETIADTRTESLGHFLSPVVCSVRWDRAIVFDRQDLRFYEIDFSKRLLRRGPRVAESAFGHVLGITSMPDPGTCSIGGSYPSPHGEDVLYVTDDSGVYVPIVGESGTIAVLDPSTWDLITGVGHLPAPHSWCGRASSKPRDLFGCNVKVIMKRPEMDYAGLMVASLSRQGAPVTIAVFDKRGHLIGEDCSRVVMTPWLTTKYLIESLHPPVLTVASFFTAYSFDAGATHRAIFVMPNSFVAQQRDRQTSFLFQFLWALVFMLPAMLFAGFLSWRVAADAGAIGLSAWARKVWMAGTFLFGLPAYITYRLMRPRCVLMVCRECGRGRRLDQEVCHHCGSEWDSRELEPPAWRVVSHQQMGAQS